MDKCLVINKFSILCYLISLMVSNGFKNNGTIILAILFYISINMGIHIIKRARWKKVLLALSTVLLTFCILNIFDNFILLMPIALYEIILLFDLNEVICLMINIVIILSIKRELKPIYILIFFSSFALLKLVSEYEMKFDKLQKSAERLRDENFKLISMINRDTEYENRLKYVSQLEERNKIAQEIHDNIGHTLSASLMQLEAANLLIDRDAKKSKGIIENTIAVLREGMENIRATLRNVKPSSEQMGINRIKLLLDSFMKNNNIEASLVHKGSLDLISYKQWKIAYENINECLTNTLRYGNATKVTVNVNVLNKLIKVEIKDNGIGAENVCKGLGIRGIEERTEGIGGKVIVDGSNGFSVIVLMPLT